MDAKAIDNPGKASEEPLKTKIAFCKADAAKNAFDPDPRKRLEEFGFWGRSDLHLGLSGASYGLKTPMTRVGWIVSSTSLIWRI
jgi:hypothetical protein